MSDQPLTPTLERDAVTIAGYASLATFGWFIYTLGPTVPLLRAEQETSRTLAGMHNLTFAVGAVVTGLIARRVMRRIQRDGGIRLGVALLTAGALALVVGSLPDGGALPLTLGAVLVAGIGGALAVNAATATLADRHGATGAAAVSEGNAVAATVGLVAPLAVGTATALALTWRGATVIVVPLAAAVWILTRRAGDVAAFAASAPVDGHDDDAGLLPLPYWLLWVGLVACIMVEAAFVTWTPDVLGDRIGLRADVAAATPAAFLAGMAVGRFTVARFALHRSAVSLFAICLVLAAGGWALLWATQVAVIAMVGLILAGLGVAGHFPLGSVLLITAARGDADRALGAMAIGLGAAAGLGPFLLGSVADRVGIHLAFLVIPACLLIAMLMTALAVRTGSVARRPAAPPA